MPLLPFSDASPPTTNASLLTSGTLANARLSSTVSLDNIDNSFTAGQTITASANTSALTASYSVTGANTTALVNLSGTWNTTGVARGILLNVTDTASAATSALMDLGVGSRTQHALTKARQFWIYNSSPATQDASNYERGFMRWNNNFLEIGSEAGGTGIARYLALVATTQSGGQYITYIQGTSTTATQGPSFNFVTSTTPGSSFSQIYAARVDSLTADLGLRGRLIHIGSAGTGFVGTSLFPALKRSSTTLQVRLADDSAFAPIQGKLTTDTAYTAATVVPTGYITIFDSTGTAYKVACSL